MIYNWQQTDWPNFTFSLESVEDLLFDYINQVGTLNGYLEGLDKNDQLNTVIETLVEVAIKSSEIEGEYLNREDVKSSVRNNLGLNNPTIRVVDERSQGMSALLVDVRDTYNKPLTIEKLFEWHRFLMMGDTSIKVGAWRTHTEPMQVISGALGKQRVHFEAPPSSQVPKEMAAFIEWFNSSAPKQTNEIKKPIVRAALTHLYFESIHPFEDGNGRIGRCLSEKALSQYLGRPILMSLSRGIEANKKAYYNYLEKSQRSNEVTDWVKYFVETVLFSQKQTTTQIAFTLKKAKFFDRFEKDMNERQLRVIQRMFEEGPNGFEGGMNARKYIGITKTSKATATRDLQELAAKQIVLVQGGGRSTSYILNLEF